MPHSLFAHSCQKSPLSIKSKESCPWMLCLEQAEGSESSLGFFRLWSEGSSGFGSSLTLPCSPCLELSLVIDSLAGHLPFSSSKLQSWPAATELVALAAFSCIGSVQNRNSQLTQPTSAVNSPHALSRGGWAFSLRNNWSAGIYH